MGGIPVDWQRLCKGCLHIVVIPGVTVPVSAKPSCGDPQGSRVSLYFLMKYLTSSPRPPFRPFVFPSCVSFPADLLHRCATHLQLLFQWHPAQLSFAVPYLAEYLSAAPDVVAWGSGSPYFSLQVGAGFRRGEGRWALCGVVRSEACAAAGCAAHRFPVQALA